MARAAAPSPSPPHAHPRADGRLHLHCAVCGYGVVVRVPPARCPMCGSGTWEHVPRPSLTRA